MFGTFSTQVPFFKIIYFLRYNNVFIQFSLYITLGCFQSVDNVFGEGHVYAL